MTDMSKSLITIGTRLQNHCDRLSDLDDSQSGPGTPDNSREDYAWRPQGTMGT